MRSVARVARLDLRVIASHRHQAMLTAVVVVAVLANRPVTILPALVLLSAAPTAGYPFMVADRARLETLHALLPVTRRTLLLGHYVWALGVCAVAGTLGTAVTLALTRGRGVPIGGLSLAMVLAVSWGLFALNIAIQFPLFVRFGYTRAATLGTTLPITLIALVVTRTHPTVTPSWTLLIVLTLAGAVALGVSVMVAMVVDPQRVRRAPTPRSGTHDRSQIS